MVAQLGNVDVEAHLVILDFSRSIFGGRLILCRLRRLRKGGAKKRST